MVTVKIMTRNKWSVQVDSPEHTAIAEIAVGFSIPVEDALAAVINRGIDSISKQLKDNDTFGRYDGDGDHY